jgi:hypothetical protein
LKTSVNRGKIVAYTPREADTGAAPLRGKPQPGWKIKFDDESEETVSQLADIDLRLKMAVCLDELVAVGAFFLCNSCGTGFQTRQALAYHIKPGVCDRHKERKRRAAVVDAEDPEAPASGDASSPPSKSAAAQSKKRAKRAVAESPLEVRDGVYSLAPAAPKIPGTYARPRLPATPPLPAIAPGTLQSLSVRFMDEKKAATETIEVPALRSHSLPGRDTDIILNCGMAPRCMDTVSTDGKIWLAVSGTAETPSPAVCMLQIWAYAADALSLHTCFHTDSEVWRVQWCPVMESCDEFVGRLACLTPRGACAIVDVPSLAPAESATRSLPVAFTLQPSAATIESLAWHPSDGTLLATGLHDGRVCLWRIGDAPCGSVQTHPHRTLFSFGSNSVLPSASSVRALAWAPVPRSDESPGLLVSVDPLGCLRLWDLGAAHPLVLETDRVHTVRFPVMGVAVEWSSAAASFMIAGAASLEPVVVPWNIRAVRKPGSLCSLDALSDAHLLPGSGGLVATASNLGVVSVVDGATKAPLSLLTVAWKDDSAQLLLNRAVVPKEAVERYTMPKKWTPMRIEKMTLTALGETLYVASALPNGIVRFQSLVV